jgi:hypothetical protein
MPEHVGVVPPPAGVTANFDYSHPWLWNANISLITVGLTLSFLCLVLRIYTKSRLLGKLGWDDGKGPSTSHENRACLLTQLAFIFLAWVSFEELEITTVIL